MMTADTIASLGLYARLQRIEMESYETGFAEPAPPMWRVCVGEFGHDMEHEQAAKNFIDAINARIDYVARLHKQEGAEK